MGEGVGHHRPAGAFHQRVVAHRGSGIDRLVDVALLDGAELLAGLPRPDPGIAIRLQFGGDRQPVRIALAQLNPKVGDLSGNLALARKALDDARAARADILIENFRPGTMERWGLGYEELSAINPRLIMVRVSGYGQTGPYSQRAGYGAIGEAMGGLRYVIGDPSTPPSRAGIAIGDTLAAMHAAFGAVMAVNARHRTGRGQVVDSAIYEAVLNFMESIVIEYDKTGYIRERTGPILPNISPSNVYPTADGQQILIGANQDTVFKRLAKAMGQPELGDDPRYATHGARGQHQQELDEIIARWTATVNATELLDLLEESGVPSGRIYRAPEMLEDAHFKARNAIVRLMHPEFGEVAMQNVAPRLSDTPGSVRHCGPELGQHTEEILTGELGYSTEKIATLRQAGIV